MIQHIRAIITILPVLRGLCSGMSCPRPPCPSPVAGSWGRWQGEDKLEKTGMYGITIAYTRWQLMLQNLLWNSASYMHFFLKGKKGTVSGKAITQRNEVRWRSTEQGYIMIPGFRLATKLAFHKSVPQSTPIQIKPQNRLHRQENKTEISSRHVGPVKPPLMSPARRP